MLVIPVNHEARGTPPHRLDCLTLYRVHSPLEGESPGRQAAARDHSEALQRRPDLLKSFVRHSPLSLPLK